MARRIYIVRKYARRADLFHYRPTLGAADVPLVVWRAARWRRMAA